MVSKWMRKWNTTCYSITFCFEQDKERFLSQQQAVIHLIITNKKMETHSTHNSL